MTRWTANAAAGRSDAGDTRAIVIDSVARHLRSDVPLCSLLSGGLDSTIVAGIARPRVAELHTYCSGAEAATSAGADDFVFARMAAEAIGTTHTEAGVSREMFAARWPAMVKTLATPLSTPNEIAINEVARTLRADGRIVTLSGEGADELFGGYNVPLASAAQYFAGKGQDPAGHDLMEAAWIPPETKAAVFHEPVWRAAEHDGMLFAWYRDTWQSLAAERDDDSPLQVHLRLTRRVNLEGLLARLDTATMLAGVEGRTPLADQVVAAHAEALAIGDKYDPATPAPMGTKVALRRAFGGDMPRGIVERPKASFPLPVQRWMDVGGEWLGGSRFARELFTEAAITTVAAKPNELWRLAWPMINLALWGRRWE
ncbi:MAG: asparagine synthase C-terminal domain-containing protein [Phycisphaerales bacterium]